MTFNSAIESIKNAVNTFVEGIRSLVDQFAETINSATSPIMAGADALSGKVTDLLTKASNLIDQIQNIVAAVIGAINKIPVSSLPEPLAKPTVTAISQVSTQFSSQLSNGAKAASTELQGIADKIAGAIEKAETTLTEQLGAAIEPLFAQIDEIVKQIEQKQLEIGQQITKQLESLSARKDELIEAAQSRIDALVKPVPEKIEEYCNQIAQTAASAEQSLRRAIEGCESRVSELAAQFERVSQRISESAQALEAMPAPLLTKLATLKAHAQSTR